MVALAFAGTAAAAYNPNPGGPPDPNQGCPPAEGQFGRTIWQTVDADAYGATNVDVNGDNVVCWLFRPKDVEQGHTFIDNRLPDGP